MDVEPEEPVLGQVGEACGLLSMGESRNLDEAVKFRGST